MSKTTTARKVPKRAKLFGAGEMYRFIPLKRLDAVIHLPVMRRIKLNEPGINHTEMWHFVLTFGLVRVTKKYAEYHQTNCVKVEREA